MDAAILVVLTPHFHTSTTYAPRKLTRTCSRAVPQHDIRTRRERWRPGIAHVHGNLRYLCLCMARRLVCWTAVQTSWRPDGTLFWLPHSPLFFLPHCIAVLAPFASANRLRLLRGVVTRHAWPLGMTVDCRKTSLRAEGLSAMGSLSKWAGIVSVWLQPCSAFSWTVSRAMVYAAQQ